MLIRGTSAGFHRCVAQLIGEDTNEWAQLMQVQLIHSFLRGGRLGGSDGREGIEIENLNLGKI